MWVSTGPMGILSGYPDLRKVPDGKDNGLISTPVHTVNAFSSQLPSYTSYLQG